jgi:hypothetical protein
VLAGVTGSGRWSRSAARQRWEELALFGRIPMGVGLVLIGASMLFSLAAHWSAYRDPAVAVAVFVVSTGLVGALWWWGPRGIGPATSLGACLLLAVLMAALGRQLSPADQMTAYFVNAWGIAVPALLAFSRPPEEPLAAMLVATAVDIGLLVPGLSDVQLRHLAPVDYGAPLVVGFACLTMIAALRRSARTVRSAREQAEHLDREVAVAQAVHRGRLRYVARWEGSAAPLLERIAAGELSPTATATVRECLRLSDELRAELARPPESVLHPVLADDVERLSRSGGRLDIKDLGLGHRLAEQDRRDVVELVHQLVDAAPPGGSLQISVLPADVDHATIIIGATGFERPDTPEWSAAAQLPDAHLTWDDDGRWWWDRELAAP